MSLLSFSDNLLQNALSNFSNQFWVGVKFPLNANVPEEENSIPLVFSHHTAVLAVNS